MEKKETVTDRWPFDYARRKVHIVPTVVVVNVNHHFERRLVVPMSSVLDAIRKA